MGRLAVKGQARHALESQKEREEGNKVNINIFANIKTQLNNFIAQYKYK